MPLPLRAPRFRHEHPDLPFDGQLEFQGVAIDVENRCGSYRSGVSPAGIAWRSKMPCHYGEVRGTVGADGDAVDVFVGDNPFAPFVWVVQAKLPGSAAFDETKSMLGFDSREDAIRAFRDAYDKPGFLLGVTRWPFGSWREAMDRPKVAAGQMTAPLTKGLRTMTITGPIRLVVDLVKAEQLGLFGPRPAPAAGTPVQVKAHQRQTAAGVVMVAPHVRHITPADAFRMKAHELRAHADSGHPTAHIAQAEIDRREAKRKAKEGPTDAVQRDDAPDRDPVPAAVDAGEPVAPPVVAEGVGDLPAPEPAPAPPAEPEPAPTPPAPEPEPDPEPEPTTSDPDEDLTTGPIDTEMRGTGGITDVGAVLWGARKHTWKRGERIDSSNIDQVENLGEQEAAKALTKAAVFGPYDHARDQALGSSPGASLLKSQLITAVATTSAPNVASRRAYVQGAEWLQHELDQIHTSDGVAQFLKEWRLMAEGHMVQPETRSGAELARMLGPDIERWNAEHPPDPRRPRGYTMVEDRTVITEEIVKYGDQSFTRRRGKEVKIPHDLLRELGYDDKVVDAGLNEAGDRVYKLTKPLKNVDNPYARYLGGLAGFSFGQDIDRKAMKANRLMRVVMGLGAFHDTHRPVARALDKDNNWSTMLDAEERKKLPQPRKKWERSFTGVERKGGAPIPAEVDGDTLRKTFGFRGVQYGNWVQQEARQEHLAHAHGALTDLADLMGIPPTAVSHGGKLGIAFGARGGGKAAAHYEPDKVTINLTHTNGAGTLAHEWGHFFDHQLAGGDAELKVNSQGRGVMTPPFVSAGKPHEALHPEVKAAFENVMHAITFGGVDPEYVEIEKRRAAYNEKVEATRGKGGRDPYSADVFAMQRERRDLERDQKAYQRAHPGAKRASQFARDASELGSYWVSPHEMFARAFEAYVEDRLEMHGRTNTYLVSGTKEKYKLAKGKVEDLEPYPHGVERAAINLAMHKLVTAMSQHQSLQKALARRLTRLVVVVPAARSGA